ncbi:MAG: cobalamin-binding protein [Ruminococcaceae bacterium]|nr:cobalamin-binding protein [Oscillospiraceae bacterium]
MKKEPLQLIIENGKNKEIIPAIVDALSKGASPVCLIDKMVESMIKVGEMFHSGKIQVSDMFSSAQTIKKGIAYLTPLIEGKDTTYIGEIVVGMAQGDLHDIGKGLLILMLESVGFKVHDLGIDVPPEIFVDAIKENENVQVVAISASLDSTVSNVKATIDLIEKEKLRDKVKIIVGGAAISAEIAKELGADAFGTTATLTAVIAKDLLSDLN